jgi:hypothetical protein
MNGQTRVTSGIPERAILVTCLALAMGCSAERSGPEDLDSLRLQLDFGSGVMLTSVHWDLTGPNMADGGAFPERMGNWTVMSSDVITANFGAPPLPTGMGYDVKVSGTASDGVSTCSGEVVFNMPRPNVLMIPLTCTGIASVSATTSVCPVIDSLSVTPAEVYLGASMQLTLAAHDADNGPSPLTATWSATSGMLTNQSTTGATFTCTAAGPAVVSVSVDDGTPNMQCVDTSSVNVVCSPLPGGM